MTPPPGALRVGLIGAGVMGSDHARRLARTVAGACVTAVCDVETGRAAAVAGELGARGVADAAELVRDPGVDAVLIASSDETHERYVLACLAEGKPVLCEKPLTPDVAGCRRIVAAEVAGGRRLVTVGFMRRYDPAYRDLRAGLAGGDLGAALMLHCVHRNPSAPAGLPSTALITNSAVHELDLARWLLREEIASGMVYASRRARAAGATRDPQLLIVQTEGGVLVDIEVYVHAAYGYDVRCELVAEQGTVTLDAPAPTLLRGRDGAGRAVPRDWRDRFAEAYRRQLQDWVDAVRAGRPAQGASAWDGYAATVAARACVAALESGVPQRVALDPRPPLYG
jgi:myo-inositol 2-dehydrogenase / D-chiro-inositol 1-dehydrogenase